MELNSIRINSDGTGRGTHIFFQTKDGKELRVNNCTNLEIGISADGIGFVKMELINFELNYNGNPVFKIKDEDFEKTILVGEVYPEDFSLNQLAAAYDSVSKLLYTAKLNEKHAGIYSAGQKLQSSMLLERLEDIDKEIQNISPAKNCENLCKSCMHSFSSCGAKFTFAKQKFPLLRGTEAGKVIDCVKHERIF